MEDMDPRLILLIGATGDIGGRLAGRLLKRRYRVRFFSGLIQEIDRRASTLETHDTQP